MMKTIYVCEDSFEGILSGVYDAWMSRRGHGNVRLDIWGQEDSMELFCEYLTVKSNTAKAEKVISAVQTKISEPAYELIYKASLSKEPDRADRIYRFLIYGFYVGAGITDRLQIPEVFRVFELCRFVDNETHLLTGFVRFIEMDHNLLVSRIGPKNDVTVLLAYHFADRMSGENWIIYDENRKKAVLHPANRSWVLIPRISDDWETQLNRAAKEDGYEKLWESFRTSITIKSRENPACQRNHMPIRYRTYMPEFDGQRKDQ